MRGQPLDPVAHPSELAEQHAGAGHDRARHGRSVHDVYPDVVDPADVVAVEVDDAVVDQVATDVHQPPPPVITTSGSAATAPIIRSC
jgi:hypothetical protein